MIENKSIVHFKQPYYFYIKDEICLVRSIETYIPLTLCYIDNNLHVLVADYSKYHCFGIWLPIKKTEEELKANNIEYKIYDRT